jgi:hypothetical protein
MPNLGSVVEKPCQPKEHSETINVECSMFVGTSTCFPHFYERSNKELDLAFEGQTYQSPFQEISLPGWQWLQLQLPAYYNISYKIM